MTTYSRSSMGWPTTPAAIAYTDTGLVIHYNGNSSWKLASKDCRDSDGCKGYWDWCRWYHMTDNGWQDVGYSYFVCPHGNTYVGRGYNRVQAAQPGGNMTWTSVTTGLGAGERPTKAQINGIRRLRQALMQRGMKAAVSWHGRFIATSCPGTVLIDMIKNGEFSRAPETEEEEPTMEITLPMLKVGMTGYDVKTVRGLLYARGYVKQEEIQQEEPDAKWLENWLDTTSFNDALKTTVIKFQKAVFPDDEDEWDGIVGDKTWAKLMRAR